MAQRKKSVFLMLVLAGIAIILILIMQPLLIHTFRNKIDMLFPDGIVAVEERNILFVVQALMLLVIVPVYILTFIFSWRYSVQNPKGKYDPHLVDNYVAEVIWWGLPLFITIIVAVITWQTTHYLDPFKPLQSETKPITIQVVALQWKWLFIYPEEKIAAVNFLQFPEKTPIQFEITADAPMNSFWIPRLGGQIYAMPSMKTKLNLIADEAGEFRGSSANISGEGFAGMTFVAKASSDEEYQQWLDSVKQSGTALDREKYNQLAEPSEYDPVSLYQLKDDNLFEQILMKFMHPQQNTR